VIAGLAVAAQVYPAELAAGKFGAGHGDSQSGKAAPNQMQKLVYMICSALKEALELAAFGFDLTARWIPRGENTAADTIVSRTGFIGLGHDRAVVASPNNQPF
jgi:hypothetical protein